MRFSGLHLQGFGLYHDLRIRDLSPRLTLFLGPNESGKSTLLSFIRAVLYGFPDGRSAENPYPPLAGGRHGGSISLVLEDGQVYTLTRYAGTKGGKAEVHGPQSGRASLDSLLGPGNKTLFRNVFAFRLEELQGMETLNAEAVGEALFSAGAGVDPGALSKLRAGLDKKEGELFRPRGPKTQIHSILTRLTVIAREKSTLHGSVAEYDQLRSGAVRLSGQVKGLEGRRVGLLATLKETEQWVRIWPEWIDFCAAGERLKELEEVDHFPPDGPSRLDGLKARLADARNELDEKEVTLGRLESELSLLKNVPSILEHASPIRGLRRDQGRFEAVDQELAALGYERARGEERLKEGLRRLGPLWDEERIQGFDLSIATREEARHHREGIWKAEEVLAGKRESLHQALSGRRLAEGVLGNLTEPTVKDVDLLLRMKSACRRLREFGGKMDALRKEALYLQEHLDELKAEKGALLAVEGGQGGAPGILPLLVGLGGAV
ncbi:MAG: AAA family ATPase, partial [Deltaproteobacteria bacterium]|nr:AAA family ATPase [Deltaproteobacteria bacterium]